MILKKRVEELEETVEMLATLCHRQTSIIEKSSKDFDEVVELCSKMDKKIEKQEKAINELTEICQTLLLANFNNHMKDLENELKDLFGSGNTRKCTKSAKANAEKCKKCGESTKTTKKKGDK